MGRAPTILPVYVFFSINSGVLNGPSPTFWPIYFLVLGPFEVHLLFTFGLIILDQAPQFRWVPFVIFISIIGPTSQKGKSVSFFSEVGPTGQVSISHVLK